jgi:Predicted nucleotide-binding protein containing TIR-like domain
LEKTKDYPRIKFDSKALSEAHEALKSLTSAKLRYIALSVDFEHVRWSFDKVDEFLAAADQGSVRFIVFDNGITIGVTIRGNEVSVRAPTREKIEAIFSVFEKNVERCRLPDPPEEPKACKVFIGHGRDPQWRDLKDHLHEKHEYAVETYEIGSRAGHTIRDILEEMLQRSSFALLVMTGEDEMKDGKTVARQNVVHEAGLFQGKLGFSRTIILLEDGTEEFSNIHGLQQIRFSKGKIRESFGDVLAVLKRELG